MPRKHSRLPTTRAAEISDQAGTQSTGNFRADPDACEASDRLRESGEKGGTTFPETARMAPKMTCSIWKLPTNMVCARIDACALCASTL
jgi:general stress protein YciG